MAPKNMNLPSMVRVNLHYYHVNSDVVIIDFVSDIGGVSSRDDEDGLGEADDWSKSDNIRSSSLVNLDGSSHPPLFLFSGKGKASGS